MMVHLFNRQGGGGRLGSKEEDDPSAIQRIFPSLFHAYGFATRVGEKPAHDQSSEGRGVYLFDFDGFDAISSHARTAMRDEYEITDSFR